MYDVTVLMIVRNGAERLNKALKSVSPLVKQIVVVDTGSIDNSAVIASQFGSEVHFLEWENDFSKARNYGLLFARYPWVLVLDHDEELNQQSFIDNAHLMQRQEVGGIRVQIVNHIIRGESYTKTHHTYTRLFRNDPRIRFEGQIHEQIAQSILDAGFELIDSNIVIDHYGYSTINIDKVHRNRKILEKTIAENPDDDWALFGLAETEFSIGNNEKAYALYDRLKDSVQLNPEQLEMIRIRLAQISLKKDEYEKVQEYCNFVSEDTHREGLRLMVLGTAFLMQHRYEEAKQIFEKPEIQFSDMVDKNQIKNALEIISFLTTKLK